VLERLAGGDENGRGHSSKCCDPGRRSHIDGKCRRFLYYYLLRKLFLLHNNIPSAIRRIRRKGSWRIQSRWRTATVLDYKKPQCLSAHSHPLQGFSCVSAWDGHEHHDVSRRTSPEMTSSAGLGPRIRYPLAKGTSMVGLCACTLEHKASAKKAGQARDNTRAARSVLLVSIDG
jgi:hypothetical protein